MSLLLKGILLIIFRKVRILRVLVLHILKRKQFILEHDGIDYDFKVLSQIHKLTCDKLVLDQNLGRLHSIPVNIGGTSLKSQFPIESQIKEELERLLNQP